MSCRRSCVFIHPKTCTKLFSRAKDFEESEFKGKRLSRELLMKNLSQSNTMPNHKDKIKIL